METIDVAVIGGGVTGLASALAIVRRGRSVCVLERHPRTGLETSTHNSGVIHAGIYYPPGSLKASLCVEGRRLLYAFCRNHGVPHDRSGKIVVANRSDQMPELEALCARGTANGVEGLELVDEGFVRRREPNVPAVAALYSPESGVLDAEAFIKALQRSAEVAGVFVLAGTALRGALSGRSGIELRTDREKILAAQVVNAAGLYADEVSSMLDGEPFRIYPCRGEYAELTPSKRSLVNSLVYPLPHKHGLGVHVLKTFSGAVWLGPTAVFQERKDDYESNRLPIKAFVEPASRLLRGITADDLRLAGSGIRPKLHGPEAAFADFMMRRDRVNPLVVQAAGIESPGLTACLAIGERIAHIVAEDR
jgi:L-2-hydroxyglutarate oxidase LhgO